MEALWGLIVALAATAGAAVASYIVSARARRVRGELEGQLAILREEVQDLLRRPAPQPEPPAPPPYRAPGSGVSDSARRQREILDLRAQIAILEGRLEMERREQTALREQHLEATNAIHDAEVKRMRADRETSEAAHEAQRRQEVAEAQLEVDRIRAHADDLQSTIREREADFAVVLTLDRVRIARHFEAERGRLIDTLEKARRDESSAAGELKTAEGSSDDAREALVRRAVLDNQIKMLRLVAQRAQERLDWIEKALSQLP